MFVNMIFTSAGNWNHPPLMESGAIPGATDAAILEASLFSPIESFFSSFKCDDGKWQLPSAKTAIERINGSVVNSY